MKIIQINEISKWDTFVSDWQKLKRICKPNHPFLEWDWVRTWADYLPLERKYPILLVIKDDENNTVGMAPFQINNTGFFKYIEGFAQEFSDYIDWLYLLDLEGKIGQLINYWIEKEIRKYDFIRISNIYPNGVAHKTLCKLYSGSIEKGELAPYVAINGNYCDYKKSLKAKFISDTERRKKQLSREVGEVEYVVINDEDNIPIMLDLVAKWTHSRRNEKNESSYLDRNRMKENIIKLYKKLNANKMLHLSALKVKSEFIAINVAFIYENMLFSYTPTFNPDYAKYSVIRLLKFKNIEECYREKMEAYDFFLGGEKYKLKFNPSIKQLFYFKMYGSNLKGLIRKNWDNKMNPMISRNIFLRKMMDKVIDIKNK